ncbi:hypothetical protein FYK55_04085 [Roseiconus nitratireducens]|uniref:Uncharacterized protein n=1 Tax=Roseiconus nitratireducens TaxID=2605748 RepID=A0A5M6DEX2_9BACT|nr:hypothetical protein [Roseiconus nitratireducens]KAA5546087.1 hypothetical protein FYK55_04085 [Roseiconus nitratireducens]
MKTRSLALSLTTALLSGSAYDALHPHGEHTNNQSNTNLTAEIQVSQDDEEKRRAVLEARRSIGFQLRGEQG